jgi:hypothetical protein
VAIYADLARAGALERGSHLNYGWDLAKAIGEVLGRGGEEDLLPSAVTAARQYLFAYLNLAVERPSLLHSRILQPALRLSSANHLKVVPFLRLWGLENFRREDFDRYVPEPGKSFPALAEKAAQQAGKEAAAEGRRDDIEFVLPFVEKSIVQYPDNIWLKHHLVKLLRGLGRLEEARSLAIQFVKAKSGEYWAWELLGDLQEEAPLQMACYCKALLCSDDDGFVSNLRLKLARHLVDSGHHPQAKGEVARVLRHKRESGYRISSELSRMEAEEWFSRSASVEPSRDFYTRQSTAAEDILFSDLPWIEGCAGEKFVIEGAEGKRTRRKLYVRDAQHAIEVNVPESRWPLKTARVGAPVRLKAEFDPGVPGKLMLHAAEVRDGRAFDVFVDSIGVVDHVNRDKGVFHCIAGKEAQGTFRLADYASDVALGDSVSLKLAVYYSKQGKGVRIVSAEPASSVAAPSVRRQFSEPVRVSNGMGFTQGGIFVPPDLVAKHGLEESQAVSGLAVLNFNKKRNEWGWKAILVEVGEV